MIWVHIVNNKRSRVASNEVKVIYANCDWYYNWLYNFNKNDLAVNNNNNNNKVMPVANTAEIVGEQDRKVVKVYDRLSFFMIWKIQGIKNQYQFRMLAEDKGRLLYLGIQACFLCNVKVLWTEFSPCMKKVLLILVRRFCLIIGFQIWLRRYFLSQGHLKKGSFLEN